MKSKKVHPSADSSNVNGPDLSNQTTSDGEKWFHYDESTDAVAVDFDSLENIEKKNKKTKFDVFLARIRDDEWGEEEEEEKEDEEELYGRKEDDELLLKT